MVPRQSPDPFVRTQDSPGNRSEEAIRTSSSPWKPSTSEMVALVAESEETVRRTDGRWVRAAAPRVGGRGGVRFAR